MHKKVDDPRGALDDHIYLEEEEWIPASNLREAVIEATKRGGTQAARALISRHWDRYASTESAHLLSAVRALPGEVFLDNAGMVVAAEYLQHLVNGGEPHRFEADHLAINASRANGSLEERLIVLTSTAASERTTGGYRQAVEAATEARLALDRASDAETAPISAELPHLFLQWGSALEVAEDLRLDVQFEYEESHRLALASQQPQIARRAAGHLAWYHAKRGRVIAAQKWLERARTTGTPSPRYEAVTHLAAALIHLDHRKPADSALELARMSAYPIGEYWSAAVWVRSWHATTPSERALLEADIGAELDRHPNALAAGGSHRLHLRAAKLHLGHPLDPAEPTHPVDRMLAASFEYRRGDYRAAITQAEHATEPFVWPRARSTALIITAAAALGLERTTVAAHNFRVAHALIEQESLYSAYGHVTREHLAHLAAHADVSVPLHLGQAINGDLAPTLATLTRRERQVLSMLPSGRTIPAIANELFISPNTVKAALGRLYRKLNVTSREAAADIAQQARLREG